MDQKHPVITLTVALASALERDLGDVESSQACEQCQSPRRPLAAECSVVMFGQSWTGEELGLESSIGGDDPYVDAETVIVTGPAGDACVYVSTRLLYRIGQPNRRFFLDVAAQRMRGTRSCALYDGRDSADQEAFDFEVAGALARACGAARRLERSDAQRVARMLKTCLDEFENLEPAGCGVPADSYNGVAGNRFIAAS